MRGNCPPWEASVHPVSTFTDREDRLAEFPVQMALQTERGTTGREGNSTIKAIHLHCVPYDDIFLPSV